MPAVELELTSKQQKMIIAPLVLGGFIALLNETLLNVAFPERMSALHVSLENVSNLTKPKIDILSIILSVIGIGCLIFGISLAAKMGLMNMVVLGILTFAVVILFFFSRRQFRIEQPMLGLRTLQYPIFSIGIILLMIAMMIPFH